MSSVLVKQSRYQQIAAARAAGDFARADELADSPTLPAGLKRREGISGIDEKAARK